MERSLSMNSLHFRLIPSIYPCLIFRATDPSGQTVALKKIRIATTEEGMPMSMVREVGMLKLLEKFEHPNIVKFVNSAQRNL